MQNFNPLRFGLKIPYWQIQSGLKRHGIFMESVDSETAPLGRGDYLHPVAIGHRVWIIIAIKKANALDPAGDHRRNEHGS